MSNIIKFLPVLGNLTTGLLGHSQAMQGADLIDQGADLSIQGGLQQAQSFRASGASAMAAANYNAQLITVNLNRQMDAMSREIVRVGSQQRAQAGKSGLDIGSASFLDVMNGTLAQFERQIVDSRISAEYQRQGVLFEGRAAMASAENQARSAQFSAEVSAHQARARADQARSQSNQGLAGLVTSVGTSFANSFLN